MIAAAAQGAHFYSNWSLDKVPFGWFDGALVAVIAFGIFIGRRNGMTKEVLPMLHALVTLLVCGLVYQFLGQQIINLSGWGKTLCYLLAYFFLMFVVFLVFGYLKKIFLPRLTGSNAFGGNEYYLGMLAGAVRFSCITFVVLAVLNAPFYTQADIMQSNAYMQRWFGGGLEGYAGDYFPTVQRVQASVFKKSLSGKAIKDYAGSLLINTAPAEIKSNPGVITFGK